MDWIWRADSQALAWAAFQDCYGQGWLGDSQGWGWDVSLETGGKEAVGYSSPESREEPRV